MEVKHEPAMGIPAYNDHLMFDNESFDILDTGMASGLRKSPEEELIEETPPSSAIGRYEEIGWAAERPPLNAGRLRMAKIFRTRDGLQRTATFPADTSIPHDQDFIDETSRAVSSVDFGSTTGEDEEEEEDGEKAYYQPVEIEDDMQPSTSHDPPRGARGNRPLQRLTLQIGKKVLRFKVVDQITPVFNDSTGKFRCPMCKLTLPTHEDWTKHNRQYHSAQKSFVCVVCGIGFTNKSSLTMHHRSHSGFKSHECSICHKVFSRATNLVQHIKMHQNGRHFCEFCGRCFKTVEQLSMHLSACIAIMNGDFLHSDKPLRYNCSYCDKMFHHKRDKFIHERVHTGEKPYQCGYCGRGFTQSQALTIHIRIHTGERPFSCTYCDKQFRDSSSLRKHEFRAHMSMNPAVYEGNEMEAGMLEDEYSNSIWTGRV